MFSGRFLTRWRLSLTTWMLLASLLSTLPLLLFAVGATARLVNDHQRDADRELVERAQAAAASVGRLLQEPAQVLRRVNASGLLPDGTRMASDEQGCLPWPALADPAAVLVRAGAAQVSLDDLPPTEAGGGAKASSVAPPIPAEPVPVLEAQAFPIERGGPAPHWVAPVALLPLRAQVTSARVMLGCVDLPIESIASVLAEQAWPAQWTATVLDQRLSVVARSHAAETYVGRPGPADLRQALRAGRPVAVFDARSLDGQLLRYAVAAVPGQDWVVSVGAPVQRLNAVMWGQLGPLLGVGLLCVLAGAAASVWLAHRLGRAVLSGTLAEPQPAPPALEPSGRPKGRPDPRPGAAVVVEFGALVDQLHRARAQAQEAHQALHGARHDALTGLPQRSLFMQELEQRLAATQTARREGRADEAGLAVLFIDLDGFKQVNDRLGHEAGDQALRDVAAVLSHCVRAGDVPARLGGDEFVVAVVAPAEHVADSAQAVAWRIVRGVQALGRGLGGSVGLVVADGRLDAAALVAHADQAMYAAKGAGKNQVVVHRRCGGCTLPDEPSCPVATQPGGLGMAPDCDWDRRAQAGRLPG